MKDFYINEVLSDLMKQHRDLIYLRDVVRVSLPYKVYEKISEIEDLISEELENNNE